MVTLGAEETVDRYNCLKSLDIIQNEKTIYRIVLLQKPTYQSKIQVLQLERYMCYHICILGME